MRTAQDAPPNEQQATRAPQHALLDEQYETLDDNMHRWKDRNRSC